MNLTIKQNNQVTEQVTSGVIDKLYNLTKEDVANGITAIATVLSGGLQGRIEAPAAYQDAVDYLNNHFGPNFIVNALLKYIRFRDANVLNTLLANNIGDGTGITANDTNISLGTMFVNNTDIEYFYELSYFKGVNLNGCSNLKGINLSKPDGLSDPSLTSLPNLNGCSSLLRFNGPDSEVGVLDLPENIKGWGGGGQPYWFEGVTNLTKMIIHAPLTAFGSNATYNASSSWTVIDIRPYPNSEYYDEPIKLWLNCVFDNGAPNTQMLSANRHLHINGSLVTSVIIPQSIIRIGGKAFKDDKDLTSCTFHNDVAIIGSEAFRDCSNLVISNLSLPGLTSLGGSAFRGCSNLISVSDLGAITELAEYTFYNCNSLASVVLPEGLTKIGYRAFANNGNLTSISFPSTLDIVDVESCSGTKITGVLSLPNVTKIQNRAFSNCSQITEVSIPNATLIEYEAFAADTGVTSYTIGTGITKINYAAFGTWSYGQSINADWHQAGQNVNEISLSNLGSYSLSGSTFACQKKLKKVLSLGQITEIGSNCFRGCTSLEVINIPNTVTTIGEDAFLDTPFLQNLQDDTIAGNTNGAVVLGDGILYTWCGTPSGNITIPSNAKKIGYFDMSSVTGIVVDSNNTTLDSRNGCNAIIETATNELIRGCSATSIPNTVTSIGNNAFKNSNSQNSYTIVIPNSVTSIGPGAFACHLTDLSIPSSVTSMDGILFKGGNVHGTLTLEEGHLEVKQGAFMYGRIQNLVLPSTITKLKSNCFYVAAIVNLTIKATTPPVFDGSNQFTASTVTNIFVPPTSVDAYKDAPGWSSYKTKIQAIPT